MAKKAQMGDFIGFCFNNIHSSELGLVRVSDGNRYEKNLFPAISDKTVQVPGRDGFYYFGSSYNSREITVKVAFDNLEENDFREMVNTFKDKKPHFLWFDELPYKEYLVKIKNPPNFKYLCFDEWIEEEDNGEITKRLARIYKGEGTIVFICYSPYARARAKSLIEEIDSTIVKFEQNPLKFYHNTFLNGTNQIDENNVPVLPPKITKDGSNYLSRGEDIRDYFRNGYLQLFKSEDVNLEEVEEERDRLLFYLFCKNIVPFFLTSKDNEDISWEDILPDYDKFREAFDKLFEDEEIKTDMYDSIANLMTVFTNNDETSPELYKQKPKLLLSYNLFEWVKSSRLPLQKNTIKNNTFVLISNSGDVDMNVKILLSGLSTNICTIQLEELNNNNDSYSPRKVIGEIKIDGEKLEQELERRGERGKDKSGNLYSTFFIDSQTKLFRAYDNTIREETNTQYFENDDIWNSKKETNEVFNNCIVFGDFFKIPVGETSYKITVENGILENIEYTYLYY